MLYLLRAVNAILFCEYFLLKMNRKRIRIVTNLFDENHPRLSIMSLLKCARLTSQLMHWVLSWHCIILHNKTAKLYCCKANMLLNNPKKLEKAFP